MDTTFKSEKARHRLERVGENLTLNSDVKCVMKFVLSNVYSERADMSRGQARASKKTTIRLSPDDDSLDHHLVRTNYISY